MADTNGPKNASIETKGERKGLGLKRAIVLIKDISILGVVFYLVYFVAATVAYRAEQHALLSFIYRLSNTAYGVASSLILYAIAHIIDQYKREE